MIQMSKTMHGESAGQSVHQQTYAQTVVNKQVPPYCQSNARYPVRSMKIHGAGQDPRAGNRHTNPQTSGQYVAEDVPGG